MSSRDPQSLIPSWRPIAAVFVVLALVVAYMTVHAMKKPDAPSVPVITAPRPIVATSTPTAPNPYLGITLQAQSAIVYDLTNGTALYSRNSDLQLPLASITKLLTVYAASTALSPDAPVTISQTALDQDGESGLILGESFKLSDIARFALVASSNDAAEAVLEAVEDKTGQDTRTVMSGAAAAAGLSKTYAVNGTGLDESTTVSGGYGTARDVALLAAALLKKAPTIAGATIEPSIRIRSLEGTVHSLPNTNQDVVHVPGILLSKTGYTDLAGGNLVIIFDAAIGHPVAIAVLGSTHEGRFTDVDRLVKATLAHFAGTTPSS